MKKIVIFLLCFYMCLATFNATDTNKEYYDETTDILVSSPIVLEYKLKSEYPDDIVKGAYYDALFRNLSSKFMVFTVRHCISDKDFDSKNFSTISKEDMGKGVNGNEYYIKYGYENISKENPMAILGTYDENFYYYMVFMFPTMDEYNKNLVKTIADNTTFGYKKNVITCKGNTGSENFSSSDDTNLNDFISNEEDNKQSSNDKYYHPEIEDEEETGVNDNVLDYEKQTREKNELQKRNMILKGVISVIFLISFVYILGSNKFEFSVFGMFFMIFQLAFIFLLDLNLIEGYSINYLYTIIYVIPGIISIILLTRKANIKEVDKVN